jgi:hypothetical protein
MASTYFPFDQYTNSVHEKEYIQDVKKKNNIVKYVNVLLEDPYDINTLRKLSILLLFFRNNFCKESFIYFFLDKFEEREKELLSLVIFDMFVRSKKGTICEVKEHLELSTDLQKYIVYNDNIQGIWQDVATELNLL